jgi:hypothetical protein
VLVRIAADRSGRSVTAGRVAAEFWAPGRDPQHNSGDEASPDHVIACLFDSGTRKWTAEVDTTGWLPGAWTLRGRVLTSLPELSGLSGWQRLVLVS